MAMSPSTILSTTPLYIVLLIPAALCVLWVLAYRIYLHPLAKYPGPWLAKMTSLYMAYHVFKGDCHLEFDRCHEKYGKIVRFGPNHLSFNSSTALKEIYGHKSNLVKSYGFYSAFWATGTKETASTHSCVDKSVHSRKRRVLAQGFSDAALKSMERFMLAHVRRFCQTLVEKGGGGRGEAEAIDISSQSSYLTFDVMGDLCFGKSFDMLDRPDNRFAITGIANATRRHYLCGMYPKLHQYHLDRVLFPKLAHGRDEYMQYSKMQLAARMTEDAADDEERKDFFHYLLNARDPETGQGFSQTELWGESNSLIIAGSDTTSTTLSATIFYLLHNPRTLSKLTREIRTTFSHVEEIEMGQKLSSLRYLRACIDEALRLSPPVGGLLPRETLVQTWIDGADVPKGTIVGVPHYALHHNPLYYPEPYEFRPERWLESEAPHAAFCPFSIGPRACIGKGMAYHELTVTLGRVIFLFDCHLVSSTGEGGKPHAEYGRHRKSEYQLKDQFTSLNEGPIVEFRRAAAVSN